MHSYWFSALYILLSGADHGPVRLQRSLPHRRPKTCEVQNIQLKSNTKMRCSVSANAHHMAWRGFLLNTIFQFSNHVSCLYMRNMSRMTENNSRICVLFSPACFDLHNIDFKWLKDFLGLNLILNISYGFFNGLSLPYNSDSCPTV